MRNIEIYLKIDRPVLGDSIPLTIFRAFRHFSAGYAEDIMGEKGAAAIFYNAGKTLGIEVGKSLHTETLEKYMESVKEFVKEQKVGILVPVSVEKDRMVLQIDECITCAGMPNIGRRICHFEAGFVGGLVEAFTGGRVVAKETKCNAMGEGICEVTVELRDVKDQ